MSWGPTYCSDLIRCNAPTQTAPISTTNQYVLDYRVFFAVTYAHDLRPGDTVAAIERTNLRILERTAHRAIATVSKVDHCANGNCVSGTSLGPLRLVPLRDDQG